MKKITTHLWYDRQAREAAEFYVQVFQDAKIKAKNTLSDTPSGMVDVIDMEIMGEDFTLISAGPLFKFNPSISLSVMLKTSEEVDTLYAKLVDGGRILMELDKYPFSERYAWIEDKYGLSWQIIAMADAPITQKIIPALMYTGDMVGKAEEAMNFYTSVFDNSKVNGIWRYEKGEGPDKEGTVAHGSFSLGGQEFIAMDSAKEHGFTFNEAISLMVHCQDQKEIDYFWEKLSHDPKAEQCGWLKDKYGVSWQIVPVDMAKMMSGDKESVKRVTNAFLKMKKFDLAELNRAFKGE